MTTQDFYQLRRKCRAKGKLFEDPEFPAVRESMFYSGGGPKQKIEWKRPHEICSDPQLFVGGASRFDVSQGMLGDCWFVAVLSSLGQDENLLKQVIPDDQSFADGEYAGIFHFRFWRFGEWIDVVVDDRLPTYYNRLIFIHSEEKNEFWSALLEKAYAKLHGSYEALKGGKASEAMVDFTGGVTETIDLTKPPPKLFRNLLKASQRKSLMSCSIGAKSKKEMEAKLDNGLVKGHAYSVTSIATVQVKGKTVELVRIRNPWGNEREWNGPWSDNSPEWDLIDKTQKQQLGLNYDDDGESWMPWQDFLKNFTELEVCSMGADDIDEDTPAKSFKLSSAQAKWSKGSSAGGCRNFPTFEKNPQFIVDLNEADDDDEDGLCSVLFGLMQKDRRAKRHLGAQDLCVGLSIYQVPADFSGKLDKKYFDYHKSTATSGSFTNLREVVTRLDLKPGRYVIIPCTFNPEEEAGFLLRIFTEKATKQSGDTAPAAVEAKVNEKFQNMFEKLAGKDGEVDADELQEILTTAFKRQLHGNQMSIETCKIIIHAQDKDYSGKLGAGEFVAVLDRVKKLAATFSKYDSTRTGYMSTQNLHNALRKLGYNLSQSLSEQLMTRFSSNGRMSFDAFLSCAYRVDAVQNQFKKREKGGTAGFSFDQFYKATLCL